MLVDQLELDVMTSGVCLACLTFVAFPLDSGNEREARRESRKLTPILWDEGLELTVLVALETAKRDGISGSKPGRPSSRWSYGGSRSSW